MGPYFDALYSALAASPVHARIGREALGDAYVGQLGYAGEPELLRLAEVAGVGPGRRVLELCCGTGGVAGWYTRHLDAKVVGVDCSLTGLRIGARPVERTSRVGLAAANVRQLPFGAASFDAILCIDGFGADFAELASEAVPLLKRGGGLALLLSLEAGRADEVVRELWHAGAEHGFQEDVTASASVLMQRWLDAYRRHAPEHIAEVGARYHDSIVDELARLLSEYASGVTERVLIGAQRP